MLIAAVDQGSSSTKGALLDETGSVHARAEAAVEVTRDGASVTHDATHLLDTVERVLAELARCGRPDAVALACQRSTCLLWDRATGAPLTRALSWQDLSARERTATLAPHAGEIAHRTGLRLSAHYAGAKLARLLDDDPPVRLRAERGAVVAGTLDAFLVHGLTGEATTEPGHAGRTLLYALAEDRWDSELAARFGVPLAALPAILPTAAPRGTLMSGPLAGTPLVALVGDQQAALIGNGGSGGDEGRVAVVHFGTGAFALTDTGAAPRLHEGLLAAVTWSRAAKPGATLRRCQLEGSVNSAGSAVDWALRLGGLGASDLTAVGATELDPERLPAFLPAFLGVGAPWWREAPGAAVAALGLADGAVELLAAVLAGVAQRAVDCLEAFAGAGLAPSLVRASGRLATLPGLAGLVADASGLPVEVVAEEEAGLRGAARLAALATGASEGLLTRPPPLAGRREPRWDATRRDGVRERWRAFLGAASMTPAPRGGRGPRD
jgi:glycerol kinase